MDKAVILARGLGTRMQRADTAAALEGRQAAMARSGLKAMIPIGRPFLDYVLSVLAAAGYRRVCLVIGPEHATVREYYQAPGRARRWASISPSKSAPGARPTPWPPPRPSLPATPCW